MKYYDINNFLYHFYITGKLSIQTQTIGIMAVIDRSSRWVSCLLKHPDNAIRDVMDKVLYAVPYNTRILCFRRLPKGQRNQATLNLSRRSGAAEPLTTPASSRKMSGSE